MRQVVINFLSSVTKADVHDIMKATGSDLTTTMKILNALEDESLIYRDDEDFYYDLEKAGIKEGTIFQRRGALFIEEAGEVRKRNTAMPKDRVLYKRGRKGLEVLKVIKRHTTRVNVTITKANKTYAYFVDDYNYKNFKIIDMDKRRYRVGDVLTCVIIDYTKRLMRIDKEVGHINDKRIAELSILYRSNAPLNFSDKVLKEASRLKMASEERTDLTGIYTVTIDGEHAKDFDDAISVSKTTSGYELMVHIADVAYFVKEGSAIDKAAKERGTSIYYTDQVVPMLPETLSNDLCSLVPDKKRATISLKLTYDDKANLIDTDIMLAYIISNRRLTYAYADEVLRGEVIDDEVLSLLAPAKDLSDELSKKRIKRGSISFPDDESIIELWSDGSVKDIRGRIRQSSEMIIENFMIEANTAVASFMAHLDWPMVYRLHPKPKKDKIANFYEVLKGLDFTIKGDHYDIHPKELQRCLLHFKERPEEAIIGSTLLKSMAKAIYSDVSEGHFALALEHYCHFTSPIRRYPDLLVGRMLHKYLFKGNLDHITEDKAYIATLLDKMNETERRAIEIERDIEEARKVEYMASHIGEVYTGRIASVTGHGLYVRLDNTIEGLVAIHDIVDYYIYDDLVFDEVRQTLSSPRHTYRLGDELTVKVVADTSSKPKVRFTIYES